MPDLYVNPVTGNNEPGRGNSSDDPLRTITFSIAEAVRRFGSGFCTLFLADGLYNRALGEEFPILIPQNISLSGAGRSVIDYERDLTDRFDICLRGGRELSNLTIQGYPRASGACATSIAISVTGDNAYLHNLIIQPHPSVSPDEKVFDYAIYTNDLNTRIENTAISGCGIGIYCSGEAAISHCTFNDNVTAISMSFGGCVVSDCDFESGNICGVGVSCPSLSKVLNSRFNGCQSTGIGVGYDDLSDSPPADKPLISQNRFDVPTYYGIICGSEAVIENNQFSVSSPAGSAIIMGKVERHTRVNTAHPEIRNNVFMRTTSPPWRVFHPLVAIYEACNPLFEQNEFTVDGAYQTTLLSINHDANPDLGGGAWGSLGQNHFLSGWIEVQNDADSIPRDIYAQNNFWRYVPPRHGPDVYTPGDYFINPDDAAVRVHTEGAEHIYINEHTYSGTCSRASIVRNTVFDVSG
ncbi:hypothetical protein AQUSIP_17100 [Aquicella siphonis]|uniref:DUF1565 domain-containing protein n=1 Tax=Aquicella siphonis TaxID=254247 RepID=A0A5E4PIX1_9COXI|nr:DUF1565 domain-containing protein [Aquicella siphonis]VVC76398.1 hypothetical protein AQUSIP_17100 [Aquicella siphonis]